MAIINPFWNTPHILPSRGLVEAISYLPYIMTCGGQLIYKAVLYLSQTDLIPDGRFGWPAGKSEPGTWDRALATAGVSPTAPGVLISH